MEKIIEVDPADLRVHPLTKGLHDLGDEDPRFIALVRSMELSGFAPDKPITIDENNRIMDGRHRWRAARRLQLTKVPAIVRPDAEAATTIVQGLLNRKHYSKSALAFEVYPLFKEAHSELLVSAAEISGKNLKIGNVSRQRTECAIGAKRVEDLAEMMGVSERFFDYARQVHDLFAKDPVYAAEMMPRLFGEFQGGEHEETRPLGLGAILSGHRGKETGGPQIGRTRTTKFCLSVKSFVFQASQLNGSLDETRKDVRALLKARAPEELERIAAAADLVKTEARARLKETL